LHKKTYITIYATPIEVEITEDGAHEKIQKH